MQWLNWFYILWAKYQSEPVTQPGNEITNVGNVENYENNEILSNEIETDSRIHPKFQHIVLPNKKKIEEIIQKIEQKRM